MYKIEVSSEADRIVRKWKKSNPQLWKKYQKIYHELIDHPRVGLGHPEALKGGKDITWSRHITAHDRIIYDIYDDVITVLVVEVEGHYNDKGRYAEAGLNKLAELYAEDENLAGCTLSVSHDETNRRLLLRLTAGAQSGFAVFVR